MKKKLFPLVLALALCLGLIALIIAADTSGLDATSAKEFYSTLAGYKQTVAYVDLRDMNADKVPELIIVSSDWRSGDGFRHNFVTVDIWQVKNGKAVKTSSTDCSSSTFCWMEFVSLEGNLYIHASTSAGRPGFHGVTDTYISADGWELLSACWYDEPASWESNSDSVADEFNSTDFAREFNGGEYSSITREAYIEYITKFRAAVSVDGFILGGGGQSWMWEGSEENQNGSSYQNVLSQLKMRANTAPAAGTSWAVRDYRCDI